MLQYQQLILFIKQIRQHNGRNNTDKIGQEGAGKRAADFGNSDRAEINRQHIKRRFGRPLHHRRHESRKTVRSVSLHGFNHHGAGAAAGKRLQNRRRRAGTKSVSTPRKAKKFSKPSTMTFSTPEARNTAMATNMATR